MLSSQTIATLSVDAGSHFRNNTPVCVNLDQVTNLPDSVLRLEEISGTGRREVPFQTENGNVRKLWWILTGGLKAGESRIFELVRGIPAQVNSSIKAHADNGALILNSNGRNVLQYNYGTVYPPEGIDSSYRRSGFIHPIWSPQGAILTSIQPKDHYHHYGLWNPWTATEFEGHEIDFWNLARKLGTVRFTTFASVTEGPVYGGFKAVQDHVVFPDSSAEKTAMKEIWDVRAYNQPSGR
jgi:hypothetical protein